MSSCTVLREMQAATTCAPPQPRPLPLSLNNLLAPTLFKKQSSVLLRNCETLDCLMRRQVRSCYCAHSTGMAPLSTWPISPVHAHCGNSPGGGGGWGTGGRPAVVCKLSQPTPRCRTTTHQVYHQHTTARHVSRRSYGQRVV